MNDTFGHLLEEHRDDVQASQEIEGLAEVEANDDMQNSTVLHDDNNLSAGGLDNPRLCDVPDLC